MNKVSYAVKISPEIRTELRKFCQENGLKQGYFVEQAIEDKLKQAENMEDVLEFQKLKKQEAEALEFGQYLKSRNV